MFTIFPAIDLRRGRCVRLRQGDPGEETVFSDDPAAMARHWVSQGATWLHVVNLDGAFGDEVRGAAAKLPLNLQRLQEIRTAVEVPIQFGGGIRSLEDIALALDLGATRVVLGTAAVQNPARVREALARFGPERIVVGIDARDGWVATHGWLSVSDVRALDLALAMADAGVQRVVYTDISRDGMLSGVDATGSVALARASGLGVIASGGVASLEDIRALVAHRADGIEGVIVGQALYTGAFTLTEALSICSGK
jgi:phosphoribosylformimino-5-aminoimidazole carboxamide ribotide isomerase